jgi:hypothetical protein
MQSSKWPSLSLDAANFDTICQAALAAERDFEKGESDGTVDALRVLETIISGLQP